MRSLDRVRKGKRSSRKGRVVMMRGVCQLLMARPVSASPEATPLFF